MTDYSRYADPAKDLAKPGGRYEKRAVDERQRSRGRMNAVDPSESRRRMAAQRKATDDGKRAEA
jgi:hypothetical protein